MVKEPIQKNEQAKKVTEDLTNFKEKIGSMLYDYTIFIKETNTELTFDGFRELLANYQELQNYKGFDTLIGRELIRSEDKQILDENELINILSNKELKLLSYMPDVKNDFEIIDRHYWNLLNIITENSTIQMNYADKTKNFDFEFKNKKYSIIGHLNSTVNCNQLMNTLTVLEQIINQL